MGLLNILKAVMGLNGTGSNAGSSARDSTQEDVDVTVEHEPEPATGSEAAVKGTTAVETDDSPTEAGSTPDVDTETEAESTSETAEDTDEAVSDSDIESTDVVGSETDEDEERGANDSSVDGAGEPVDSINGIGPAYAERLDGVDIETVGDLAAADAADIAAETDLSEKRVQGWIDSARGDG